MFFNEGPLESDFRYVDLNRPIFPVKKGGHVAELRRDVGLDIRHRQFLGHQGAIDINEVVRLLLHG